MMAHFADEPPFPTDCPRCAARAHAVAELHAKLEAAEVEAHKWRTSFELLRDEMNNTPRGTASDGEQPIEPVRHSDRSR